jgi:hypothetical protein
MHALSGIQTRDPSNRADADLSLKPCGHLDRLSLAIPYSEWQFSNSGNISQSYSSTPLEYQLSKRLWESVLLRPYRHVSSATGIQTSLTGCC